MQQLIERGDHDGLPARFITITCADCLSLDAFQRAFRAFRQNLRRAGIDWAAYISVLGVSEHDGRLHRHVLALGPYHPPRIVADCAARAQLGHVDVRRIGPTAEDRSRIGHYLASNARHYAAVHTQGGGRIAPVSRSR